MGKPFQYKHFRIIQDKTPMKVGTDGVLIGAWCNAKNKKHVLDIGTGTGLISLMIAQRFSDAKITGIEINKGAFENAEENFKSSPWSERLSIINKNLNHFTPINKYDLIVSNPPYFINCQKNQETGKTTARHTDELSFEELLSFIDNYLTEKGSFELILPAVEGKLFIKLAEKNNFHLNRICSVRPKQYKKAHRYLLSFSRSNFKLEESALTIELKGRHQYSFNYRALTKDFYLKF